MSTPVPRYHAFSNYLRGRYGTRIQKIPLDAGFGCPHRTGIGQRSGTGCSYCSNAAFSPHAGRESAPPLDQQLKLGIRVGKKRYRAGGFIAYFQAYTSTFGEPAILRQRYDVIRAFPEIVGLAVGARPDCAPEEVLALLESYSRDYEVWVEFGLQSANNSTLERVGRGHTAGDFLDAVRRASRRRLNICAHVILGLPGEGPDEMLSTAKFVAELPIQGIKIHHCHVVRDTPLAEEWQHGAYRPIAYEDYLSCVCDFLEVIPWRITIQRLFGEAPEELLLAPKWDRKPAAIRRDIQDELDRRGSRQGIRAPDPRREGATGRLGGDGSDGTQANRSGNPEQQ